MNLKEEICSKILYNVWDKIYAKFSNNCLDIIVKEIRRKTWNVVSWKIMYEIRDNIKKES